MKNYNEFVRDIEIEKKVFELNNNYEFSHYFINEVLSIEYSESSYIFNIKSLTLTIDNVDTIVNSISEGLDIIFEKVKSQRYKGRKIPGKYLTKNPTKMKKEIEEFRGKKKYKKDWDADYNTGIGGKGKRVKTKKSPATKAYQKMFGK